MADGGATDGGGALNCFVGVTNDDAVLADVADADGLMTPDVVGLAWTVWNWGTKCCCCWPSQCCCSC